MARNQAWKEAAIFGICARAAESLCERETDDALAKQREDGTSRIVGRGWRDDRGTGR